MSTTDEAAPQPVHPWAQQFPETSMTPVTATVTMNSDLIFDIALAPIQDLLDLLLIDSNYALHRNPGKINSESRVEDRSTFAGPFPVGAAHSHPCEVSGAQSATGLLSVHQHLANRLKNT